VDRKFFHPNVDKLTEIFVGRQVWIVLEFLELGIENCSDCLKHVRQALFVADQMLDAVFEQLSGALFDLGIKSRSVGFQLGQVSVLHVQPFHFDQIVLLLW
jgi:hypothetical protein